MTDSRRHFFSAVKKSEFQGLLHYIIIQLTPHWGFSVTDYIKYYAYLCYCTYLAYLLYLYFFTTIATTFLTVFNPVNFPSGREPERPEKTHDFRQSVDLLFSHESVARIEPTIPSSSRTVKIFCKRKTCMYCSFETMTKRQKKNMWVSGFFL
jgi:hypothetical protein